MSLETKFNRPHWVNETKDEQEFVLLLAFSQPLDEVSDQLKHCFQKFSINSISETSVRENQTEIIFKSKSNQVWDVFQSLLSIAEGYSIDVSIVPMASRTKKLLVCDMDSTIVASETLDDVAEKIGIGEQVKIITERAMRGELDFQQALDERVNLLAGLSESLFYDIANEVTLNKGARELIEKAKANRVKTVLVSGGFEPIVKYIAEQLGFDRYVCNALEVEEGLLTGKVKQPIVDASTKLTVLKEEAELLGVSLQDTCSVGDGANDLPMLQAAGLGIAYRGKPLLKQSIPYQVNHTGLDTIAFIMGIA